jgi:hypothetical protein
MSETKVHDDTKPKKKRTLLTYVKYTAGLLLLLLLGLAMIIVIRFRNDAKIPYTVSTEGITIPTFSELEIDFAHHYEAPTAIQTAAGAIIDVDNQGADELFLGGGQGQPDKLFRYENGTFVDITAATGYEKSEDEATMSAVSLDVDSDGDDDLIVTRSTNFWIYTNFGGNLTGYNHN